MYLEKIQHLQYPVMPAMKGTLCPSGHTNLIPWIVGSGKIPLVDLEVEKK
jgi:hypothetical protein